MKIIEVTVEVRRRYTKQVELPDEEYEDFINGEIDEVDIPEIDFYRLFDECRVGDVWEETDYAIHTEDGEVIVNWND